ncbi:MAG: DsbA family protein [Elusimicrobiales bacterium]|nr:DsbA family protein [Elusimicrobiales bacterium]
MKKTLLLLIAAFLACPAFAQQASAPAKAGGRLELYLESMDSQGWQWFFMADTVRRRLGSDLKVYPLFGKGADGAYTAPRGEPELAESARLAVINAAWPAKTLTYLNGRSLSPAVDGWRDAALFAGLNPDELERRAAADNRAVLDKAYAAAKAAGVTATTLLLDGKPYAGSPRLMALYAAVNAALPAARRVPPPAGYKPAPKPPPPGLWVIVTPEFQKNDSLINVFDRYFEDIKPVVLDYASPERAAKFPSLDFVPAYVLDATPEAKNRLQNEIGAGLFKEKGAYLVYEDRQRRGLYASRPETKGTVELFVMSQCPFGVLAENSLLDAEKNKLLPPGVKLQIRYIGDAKKDDKGALQFSSLHGQPEWEENARQLFINKKFPEKFRAYLAERNKEYSSPDWQKAAKAAGLDPAKVEAGFEEGKKLLAEDFAVADALGISTSPSFVVDGQKFMVGLGELIKVPGFEKVPPPGQPSAGCAK